MLRRSAAFLVAFGLTFTACSSGSDDTAPTTVPPTAAPATDPPAETKTTPASTTTEAPTTTTTVAPTTTLDPTAQIEAAVKQARLDREAAYFASASDPSNVALREAYRATHTADSFVDREAFLDALVADGTALRSNPDVPTEITFTSPVEVVSETEATIAICRIDSDVIYIPATDSSPEVIVDDRISTTLSRTRFRLVNDHWLVDGGEFITRWEGAVSCEP